MIGEALSDRRPGETRVVCNHFWLVTKAIAAHNELALKLGA